MADEAESSSPGKKVAKKKHYPFGTPSHLNHAFSEFAHLPVETRSFAQVLATATDVKAEVVDDEPKKPRRSLPTPKKKKGKKKKKKTAEDGEESVEGEEDEEDEDDDEDSDSITNGSGLQPCTKIGCQMVIRAIADIQLKNQVEKMDIEDEFDHLSGELQMSEQDIVSSEAKLDKLTDIGNQLEIKLTQIMTRVESLEKTKESLHTERTDINTKLMLLEVERQKANRRLEKAQKELTNARWKKKKQAQQQDADAGISLPVSAISESSIVQAPASVVSRAGELYETDYNYLAKPQVVDYIERPPTVKTLPTYVQEKMFDSENVNRLSSKLDKYTKRHYKKLAEGSIKSWEAQEGTVLASSYSIPSHNGSVSQGMSHQGSLSSPSQVLAQPSMMTSMVSTAASTRVGSTLLARTSSSSSVKQHVDPKTNKTLHMLESIHSLMEYTNHTKQLNENHTLFRSSLSSSLPLSSSMSSSAGGSRRKQLRNSSSVKLQPLPGGQVPLGLDSMSTLSNVEDIASNNVKDYYEEFQDKLAGDGIFLERSYAPGAAVLEGGGTVAQGQKKKLDGVFYNNTSRSLWGRSHVLGEIRTRVEDERETSPKKSRNRGSNDGDDDKRKGKGGASSNSIRKGGVVLLDTRTLPKVTSRTLTTKHPGMTVFEDSMSVR